MSRNIGRNDQLYQIKENINKLKSFGEYKADKLVNDAKEIAEKIKDLKTAQLRRIYGEVKRIEMDFEKTGDFNRDRLVLLKPRLAYAASKKDEVKPLTEILSVCIDKINSHDDFAHFVNFFEAILAYHKG